MLKITEHSNEENYRTLTHGENIFHKALSAFIRFGDCNFHVRNTEGRDYDLHYINNSEALANSPVGTRLQSALFLRKGEWLPHYLEYDEHMTEKILFDVFDRFDGVFFDHLDEYTIVITKVLLANTDLDIYWSDRRINWFTGEDTRIRFASEMPAGQITSGAITSGQITSGRIMSVPDYYVYHNSIFTQDTYESFGSIELFHDMFALQWLTDLPLSQVKYVEMLVPKVEGLGMIIRAYMGFNKMLKKYNWKLVMKRGGVARFQDELIEKYFNIEFTPPDATEDNMISVSNFGAFLLCYTFMVQAMMSARVGKEILNDSFRQEIREYEDAVFHGRKMLGVLLRGTDHVTVMPKWQQPYPMDQTVEFIRDWIAEYGYEGIFLATEDQDCLDRMRSEFPGMVVAVSQERARVSDLNKLEGLQSLEKRKYTDETREDALTDTTVNYFYALYILSDCRAFISNSKLASGNFLVIGFNDGKFERVKVLNA